MPSFSDINELEKLILDIIDAQSVTQKQIFQIGQYYKHAKEMHSQGNISLATEIMRAISGVPADMQGLTEYHFKATGYAEALLFVSRSSAIVSTVKTESERKVVTSEPDADDEKSVPSEVFSSPRQPPSYDVF